VTIAELFVTIGVKGTDTAVKAVTGVKSSLADVASSSLAAKAAVLTVVYALERMMSASAQMGMGLQQFSASTGLSTDRLQRWQYAARQFGVGAEEVTGSVRGIQNAMTNMLMGKGAPEGMFMLSKYVGFDRTKARDTFYVMEKLQEFAKVAPPDIAGNILKSFGISESMFSFLRQNKMDLDKIKPSSLFSEREIAALARVDVAWANLWSRLKLLSGGLTAKFGLFAVDEISKSLSFLQRLFTAMNNLIGIGPTMIAVFTAIGVALYAALGPIGPIVAGLGLLFAELEKVAQGKDNAFAKIGKWLEGKGLMPDKVKDISDYGGGDPMKHFGGFKGVSPDTGQPDVTVNVYTQTKEPEEHGNIVGRAVNSAFRQNKAILGGT
jgi:hypothetical protein